MRDRRFRTFLRLAVSSTLGVVLAAGCGGSSSGSSSVSRVPATRGNLEELRVAKTIPLSSEPGWLAATDEAIWISFRDDVSVAPVDPATNRLGRRIRLRPGAGTSNDLSMAAGPDEIWVGDQGGDQAVRVDAATGRIGPTVNDVFVIELTLGSGSLWLAEFEAYRVIRVNPETREVMARLSFDGPTDVKAGAGSIWVLAHRADEVLRIDPSTNRVTATIPLISSGSTPQRMAFGERALWVSDPVGQSVTRVDPVPNKATVEIKMPGVPYSWPVQVAAGGGYVWVTGAQHLFRIDPRTNTVTGAARLTANQRCDIAEKDSENCLLDVQYAFGDVWVTDRVNRRLYRVAAGDD